METINPDDIDDIARDQISIITLKNGNMITIDDTVPAKKTKKNKSKRNSFSNYQISQRLINLTIISKEKKQNNENLDFNSKNKICQNINFFYINNNVNNIKDLELVKEKKKNTVLDYFKYSDIGNKKYFPLKYNLVGNSNNNNNNNNENNKNENLKTESNKDEKEIEKIKVVEMDLDSKSKNEYKTLLNEFDYKKKNKINIQSKLNNINNLLNSNHIIYNYNNIEPKKFDFASHLNSLVNNFRNKLNDLKRENINTKYYEIYKGIKNKNRKNHLLNKSPFKVDAFYIKGNYLTKSNKYLTNSTTVRKRDLFLRNNNNKNNIINLKDNLFKKNSSFDPKKFRTLYLGPQIILPSNQLI